MHATKRALSAMVGLTLTLAAVSACSINPTPAAAPADSSAAHKPGPTAAPVDARTAEEVLDDLTSQVDSAKLVKAYTEDDDPNKLLGRPNGYTSKVAFSDSRIAKKDIEYTESDAIERGGSVEVYPEAEGAKQRADYIQAIGKSSSALANEYDYLKGPILVRVTGILPPSKAKDYQVALG